MPIYYRGPSVIVAMKHDRFIAFFTSLSLIALAPFAEADIVPVVGAILVMTAWGLHGRYSRQGGSTYITGQTWRVRQLMLWMAVGGPGSRSRAMPSLAGSGDAMTVLYANDIGLRYQIAHHIHDDDDLA